MQIDLFLNSGERRDTNEQQPMTLREAIALALTNNKDIEVARDNVKIAEYDLLSSTAHTIQG